MLVKRLARYPGGALKAISSLGDDKDYYSWQLFPPFIDFNLSPVIDGSLCYQFKEVCYVVNTGYSLVVVAQYGQPKPVTGTFLRMDDIGRQVCEELMVEHEISTCKRDERSLE